MCLGASLEEDQDLLLVGQYLQKKYPGHETQAEILLLLGSHSTGIVKEIRLTIYFFV
jgi:hypothetical protein